MFFRLPGSAPNRFGRPLIYFFVDFLFFRFPLWLWLLFSCRHHRRVGAPFISGAPLRTTATTEARPVPPRRCDSVLRRTLSPQNPVLSLSLSLKSFQRRQLSTLQLIAVLRLLPSGRISLSTNNGNVSAPAVTAYRPSKITQRVSFTKRLIGQPVEPKRNSSTRKLVDFSPKFVRSNKEEALSTYTQRSASEGHLVSSWLS